MKKILDKKSLRLEMKHRLSEISHADRVERSKRICHHLLETDVYHNASTVMAFLSMPHEVDTTPIILHAWQQGKNVAVPKVSFEQRHMIPVEIHSLDTGLEKTCHNGLRNPAAVTPTALEEIDLILVPGLCFDRRGNRLGRGGSYYDRFLSSESLLAPRWALAFAMQVLAEVPCDAWDIPVDAVVSENGVCTCEADEQVKGV